ncbi:odorant receptor 94b-like [Rhynchophorus ferrugineus]|uniref:odorant receptor 94b-like n=1 Tax=Rhynchophorus ferrugineus TaxID=354439 RepID=UPI003FCE0504
MIVEGMLEDFNNYPLTKFERDGVNDNLKSTMSFSKLYRANCIIASCLLSIPPLIVKAKYTPPTSMHIPYDITSDKVYIVTYSYQVILVVISAHLNTIIDILFIKLVTLATCLFEVLIQRLNKIGYFMDMEAEQHFRQCLIFHNKTLRFIDIIEKLYCYVTFSQLAGSVAVICFGAFGMVIAPIASGDFVVNVAFFINMVSQVALYCWYGHNMRALSVDLNNACYMSKWYNTSKKLKKMLIIFMERSKKPAYLTAGKLFPMTLTTLTLILRSSYSYFAVLQQIYSEK